MATCQFPHREKFDFTNPKCGRSGFSALKDSDQLQDCQTNLSRYKLILYYTVWGNEADDILDSLSLTID